MFRNENIVKEIEQIVLKSNLLIYKIKIKLIIFWTFVNIVHNIKDSWLNVKYVIPGFIHSVHIYLEFTSKFSRYLMMMINFKGLNLKSIVIYMRQYVIEKFINRLISEDIKLIIKIC